MAAQSRIKTAYLANVLRQTAERIRTGQSDVISQFDLFDSNNRGVHLRDTIRGDFKWKASGDSGKLVMKNIARLRFLDIKDPRRKNQKKGYGVYNQIAFRVLYNRTLPALKFGLTDDVQEQITRELASMPEGEVNIRHNLRTGIL